MDAQACEPSGMAESLQEGTSDSFWTTKEQILLGLLMSQYPADEHPNAAQRCVLIANGLTDKTARDVALRLKWMSTHQQPPHLVKPVLTGRAVNEGNAKKQCKLLPARQQQQQQQQQQHGRSENGRRLGTRRLDGQSPGSGGGVHGTSPIRAGMGAMHICEQQPIYAAHQQLLSGGFMPSNTSGNTTVAGDDGYAFSGTLAGRIPSSSKYSSSRKPKTGNANSGAMSPLDAEQPGANCGTPPLRPLPPPLDFLPLPSSLDDSQATQLLRRLMVQSCDILDHIRANMAECKVGSPSDTRSCGLELNQTALHL
jgi:hypothetical protein